MCIRDSTCCVLAVTGALKVFDLPWMMFPNGMPYGKTWLTGTYMYYYAFVASDADYSSCLLYTSHGLQNACLAEEAGPWNFIMPCALITRMI